MVSNIFRYLAGTKHLTITYRRQGQGLQDLIQVFSDASFANSLSNRNSFSGYGTFYNASPVAWAGTKQPIAALSSTEAEYIALTSAIQYTV
jgi:ribonuclease HI